MPTGDTRELAQRRAISVVFCALDTTSSYFAVMGGARCFQGYRIETEPMLLGSLLLLAANESNLLATEWRKGMKLAEQAYDELRRIGSGSDRLDLCCMWVPWHHIEDELLVALRRDLLGSNCEIRQLVRALADAVIHRARKRTPPRDRPWLQFVAWLQQA